MFVAWLLGKYFFTAFAMRPVQDKKEPFLIDYIHDDVTKMNAISWRSMVKYCRLDFWFMLFACLVGLTCIFCLLYHM